MPTIICRGFLNKSANDNLGKRSWICVELSRTLLQRKLEFIKMIWRTIISRATIEILGSRDRIFSQCAPEIYIQSTNLQIISLQIGFAAMWFVSSKASFEFLNFESFFKWISSAKHAWASQTLSFKKKKKNQN